MILESVDEMQKSESVMQDLMSSSFYLDMLNDTYRNQCYRQALQKVVKPGE